jgi:hypothetical protein
VAALFVLDEFELHRLPLYLMFRVVEQFEKCIDALQELTANLRTCALDQMHRYPTRAAVIEPHLRVFDPGDVALGENSHPIDQRGAIRSAWHRWSRA